MLCCSLIYSIISSSKLSPATLIDFVLDAPPDDMNAISVVPAPTFTTKCPFLVNISIPAPIAAIRLLLNKYLLHLHQLQH